MDGVGAGVSDGLEDAGDVQVGSGGIGRADADRLVGSLDEGGLAVHRRVDRHRLDPQLPAGPDDPLGDLPPVRDEDLGEGGLGGGGGGVTGPVRGSS